MSKKLRILLLEDVPEDAELVKRQLRKEGLIFTSERVETREDFIERLQGFKPDLIIADYTLPSFNAREAIEIVQEQAPLTPIVVCTGSISEEVAAECIKAGASDYVIKEHIVRLGTAVRGALEKKQALEEKARAEEEIRKSKEYTQSILDNSLDLIFTVRSDGTFNFFNKSLEPVTGYKAEELSGRPFIEKIVEDERPGVIKSWVEEALADIPGTYETKITKADGEIAVGISLKDVRGCK